MSITQEVSIKTIVLVVKSFNPSILKESLFLELGLIKKSDLIEESIFTDTVAQLITNDFILIATAQNIQLHLKSEINNSEIIENTLLKLLKEIKYINYIALGINFVIDVIPTNGNNQALSTNLIYKNNSSPVAEVLGGSDDCFYGSYFSKDIYLGRMKLNITPISQQIINGISKDENKMIFNFNFHHDLNVDNPIELISNSFNKWNDYFEYSINSVKNIIAKL